MQGVARVLVTSFGVAPGPHRHGVQLQHSLRALADRFEVDVLTVQAGELAYMEQVHGCRMLRVPLPDAPLLHRVDAFRRALLRQLAGAEYDVIHAIDPWSCAAVGSRRPRPAHGIVFERTSWALGDAHADPEVAQSLAQAAAVGFDVADLIITLTDCGRRALLERGLGERVVVVPPGVDVDRFDVDFAEREGPLRVAYAGPLAPGRGVRVLLRAMRDVALRTDAQLVLIGPIESGFKTTLTQAIEHLGLRERVELVGAVEHGALPRWLATATMCVAPSVVDSTADPTAGFPTKILEYMACQRAVVAPRHTVVLDVIEDGVDGLLFELGNPSDLARQIERLFGNADLRVSLGVSAHRAVRECYPASATRRCVLQAYARLVPPDGWRSAQTSSPPPRPPGTFPGPLSARRGFLAAVSDAVRDRSLAEDTLVSRPPIEAVDDTLQVGPARVLGDEHEAYEPWMVVPPRSAQASAAADTESGTDPSANRETISSGPGVEFVAGELEASDPALRDEDFTAAGDLLGAARRDGRRDPE